MDIKKEYKYHISYYTVLVSLFLTIGIFHMIMAKPFPRIYMSLLMFFSLKTIFNYRKCTISYLECKIRGVSKERGYLNQLMDGIIDHRYDDDYIYFVSIVMIMNIYDFLTNKNVYKPKWLINKLDL